MLRLRLGYLVVAITLFAAIAVGATGALLLNRFRAAIRSAVADRQALLAQSRARLLGDELARLQAEITRLSHLAEVDLADQNLEPEKRVLKIARRDSAAFSVSIAIVDATGQVVWSEPLDVSPHASGATLLRISRAQERASVWLGPGEIDVAAPIAGQGAIVGIVSGRSRDLFGDGLHRVLHDRGNVALVKPATGGDELAIAAAGRAIPAGLWFAGSGQSWMHDRSGGRWLVTQAEVGGESALVLRLVQAAPEVEQELSGPFRSVVVILAGALLLAIGGGALLAMAIGWLEAAQVELAKARELAAMGKTAAAIAHEVKNSLNGLSVAIDLLASGRAERSTAEAVHAQAREEISRLRNVADDLTLFAAPPRLDLRPADLNAVCRSAAELGASLAADCGAEVEVALADEPLWMHGDPQKLLGAVSNIVRNGLEAMGPGAYGEPLGSKPPTREHRLAISSRRIGRTAVIEVTDTGAGLAPEVRRRLFEPFVTTKRTGTGLGLAIARRVVEAHGGQISAADRPGGGTTFRIVFPLSRAGAPDEDVTRPAASPARAAAATVRGSSRS